MNNLGNFLVYFSLIAIPIALGLLFYAFGMVAFKSEKLSTIK